MKCWIYKGSTRQETYLFLPDENDTARVPAALLNQLGTLEFVMELSLSPERRLAHANPVAVMDALAQRGYYLQLPPPEAPGAERIQ